MIELPQNLLPLIAVSAGVIALLLLIMIFERPLSPPYKRKSESYFNLRRYQNTSSFGFSSDRPNAPTIHQILNANFYKKPLMNKEEYQLFIRLENLLAQNTQGMRLFSQVSLGEILGSNDKSAYLGINSKRCDFLIVDKSAEALIVIEYHGSGHFQGNSSERDEMKRLALKKATIPTVEVLNGYQWADVESDLKKELGWSEASGDI